MIVQCNPRVAMCEALQVTDKILSQDNQTTLKIFLDRSYKRSITVIPGAGPERPTTAIFRYRLEGYCVKENDMIVKDRHSGDIKVMDTAEYMKLYQEDPMKADKELERLANYILKHFPQLIGQADETGQPTETAADVSLRIFRMYSELLEGVAPQFIAASRSVGNYDSPGLHDAGAGPSPSNQ